MWFPVCVLNIDPPPQLSYYPKRLGYLAWGTGMTQTGMQFTGYVGWGGSAGWGHGQLVTHEEMGLGWMFFKRCTAASVFKRWRWDLLTHKASVSEIRSAFMYGCWHKPHHQTVCALASFKARRGSLLQAIRRHLTTDFHLVFWYPMRKCSFSEHRSMLPFEEDFLGTVFTFVLI